MLDRTLAPAIHLIPSVSLPLPQIEVVNENTPLYVFSGGTQPVIKLYFVAQAGRWFECRPGVATLAAKMLKKGTQDKDATAIAEYIDQYGALLEVFSTLDTFEIHLTTLQQHLEPMLALVQALLTTPTFPEDALKTLKRLEIQHLRLNDKKNNRLAHKKLRESIFGLKHPYGTPLQEADIEAITQEELVAYYQKQFHRDIQVFVSGPLETTDITLITTYLKDVVSSPLSQTTTGPVLEPCSEPMRIPRPESLQASVAIGKQVCLQTHSDFPALYIVNELLGGYFGSRLMQNLREEKGYTYGAYSSLIPHKHACYLYITTDVVKANAQQTCDEIYKEIERLHQQPAVEKKELEILKNYLLGKLLRHTETPYAQMAQFVQLHLNGLTSDYYTALYDQIHCIQTDTVQRIANTYLGLDTFHQVTVGA